ncbi:MAG: ABC transporter substrate-binding protein [Actinomycetes bacterium]|jgi:branched-chain amino acid transport system substrate-binding protein|nr:ABC transporter substrate-binding protein [Actinomycetes bacterium]
MKKYLVLLSVLLLVVAALFVGGCRRGEGNGENTNPDAATGTEAEGDTIIIGGALSLTGIQAPLDAPAVEGAQIAVEEINAAGGVNGKQLEFRNMDGKSDPAVAGEVAQQLLDEGAAAIITASDYDFGGPAARAAQAAGKVGVSPCASSPLFGSAMLGDKQFTLSMWNTTMGAVVAEKAYKEDGFKTVYVVTDDFIDYTKSLSKYFMDSFTDQGGKVLLEDTFSQGKLDTAALLAHYKSFDKKPDFIYVSSYMPDLGTVLKEFRTAGINVPIYGGDAYDDPALVELLGADFGNDIVYDTHSYLSADAVPGFTEYADAYKAKFNEELNAPWSMAGYDVVKVLAEAMTETGGVDGAAMAKYMEENAFQCLTGQLDWSDAATGHEPNKAAALVQVTDGKTSFLGWKIPEKLPKPESAGFGRLNLRSECVHYGRTHLNKGWNGL